MNSDCELSVDSKDSKKAKDSLVTETGHRKLSNSTLNLVSKSNMEDLDMFSPNLSALRNNINLQSIFSGKDSKSLPEIGYPQE